MHDPALPSQPAPLLPLGPRSAHARVAPVPLSHPFRPHPGVEPAQQDAAAELLLCALRDHLLAAGHELSRCTLKMAGEPHPLAVDLVDLTSGRLVVARGTTSRPALQEAIGELLDLGGLFGDTLTKTLLVPKPPDSDLTGLLSRLGITWLWPRDADFCEGTQCPA